MRSLHLLFCLAVSQAQDYIEGEYFIGYKAEIVQTKEQEESFAQHLRTDYNINVKKSYTFGSKKLFYVDAEATDVDRVRGLPEVRYVSQNAMAYKDQECPAPVAADSCWGLDRIDQVDTLNYTNPLDPDAKYLFDAFDGSGVRAYVADTGIDINHWNFEGRAFWGYAGEGITNPNPGDIDGHGTHCAGTIGSRDYGVAKGVTLVAVKILNDNGSGPWSAIIDGLEWILNRDDDRGAKSVVSMSVGGGGQQTEVKDAIDALVADNVVCVVSAGNSNTDACTQTPAYIPSAITVGASDVEDVTATFTNYGPCVDIYGPGVNILSTQPNNSTAVFSGTSMSCPHVSGACARYLSFMKSAVPVDNVDEWLTNHASVDKLTFRAGQDPAGMNWLLHLPCPMVG